ncbi:MAG: hypothetical protein Q8P11_00810 [bacterium]|nr:hypothetical protein [bacterium]
MIGIIISIVVSVACVVVIFLIVKPRLSILASIDLAALPEERARNVKNKIISERIKRKFYTARKMTSVAALPFSALRKNLGQRMGSLQKKVVEMRDKQRRAAVIGGASASSEESLRKQEVSGTLMEQAEECISQEHFDEAEKRYIDAIALDSNNMDAYDGLGEVYMLKKEWEQAREVLEYLCNRERDMLGSMPPDEQGALPAQLAKHLYDLSQVHLNVDNQEASLSEILEAVDLDKNNPKLLDALVEMHIIQKQRLRAERALDQLRRANPDNKKLDELAERIRGIGY